MRKNGLLFPAIGALAFLPAVSARADVTSCRDELQQLAQTYHLSVSPPAQSAVQPSPGATAEAPATTESRGIAGPDSLASSGGTLPPSTNSAAPEQRSGAAPAQQPANSLAPDQLGATDRAKVEGLLSQGQAAEGQGKGDQCLQALRDAQEVLQRARQ
jgi:hypothetical protein